MESIQLNKGGGGFFVNFQTYESIVLKKSDEGLKLVELKESPVKKEKKVLSPKSIASPKKVSVDLKPAARKKELKSTMMTDEQKIIKI